MTKILYIGDEPSTEAFGKTFVAGEATDDSGLDAYAVATLLTNPQFAVTESKADAKARADAAPVEPAPDPAA